MQGRADTGSIIYSAPTVGVGAGAPQRSPHMFPQRRIGRGVIRARPAMAPASPISRPPETRAFGFARAHGVDRSPGQPGGGCGIVLTGLGNRGRGVVEPALPKLPGVEILPPRTRSAVGRTASPRS